MLNSLPVQSAWWQRAAVKAKHREHIQCVLYVCLRRCSLPQYCVIPYHAKTIHGLLGFSFNISPRIIRTIVSFCCFSSTYIEPNLTVWAVCWQMESRLLSWQPAPQIGLGETSDGVPNLVGRSKWRQNGQLTDNDKWASYEFVQFIGSLSLNFKETFLN